MAAVVVVLAAGCHNAGTVKLDPGMKFVDTQDQNVAPLADPAGVAARVIIFISVDCPIANGYAPEIKRLMSSYANRSVAFTLVQVDRDVTVAEARQHAREYGYACIVVLDPHHQLVKAMGATVTPEAAVIDSAGRLVYRGRIDDQYVDLGKKRIQASEHDLSAAIDSVLRSEPVHQSRTKAIGCFIAESTR